MDPTEVESSEFRRQRQMQHKKAVDTLGRIIERRLTRKRSSCPETDLGCHLVNKHAKGEQRDQREGSGNLRRVG